MLSLTKQSLAARSCDLCRKYYFDEETGEPVHDARTGKGFMLRRDKVPCETSIGCRKGHWKDKPDLTTEESRVLSLYWASKATNGAALSVAHKRSRWLMGLLGRMECSAAVVAAGTHRALVSAVVAAAKGG